ncbi:hypothetical protein B0H14DRAFT_2573133 [Mycena olivaceomarginata]|nr:hypothetical protein B0H14DRAFT_2573133 [Mycena olivaceomarginata]
MSSDSTPVFPPELEREIFETIAYHYPEMIANLLLVSRRVYDCIRLSSPMDLNGLVRPSICCGQFGPIQGPPPSSTAMTSLPCGDKDQCGIQNLMIPVPIPSESIIPDISALKPQRLSLFWAIILGQMNPRQPTFTFLTHFHMWDALFSNDTSGTIRLSSFLGQLPVLTHFAAFLSPSAGDDFLAVAQDILTACKAPRFFILNAVNWETKLDSLPSINDVRYVYICGYNCVWDSWLPQTRGKCRFWLWAEAFVVKIRGGEIRPASRCWISAEDDVPGFESF